MKFLVKNSETGTIQTFELPDNMPQRDVQRVKEYLANGGMAKRDFNISPVGQAQKAYVVPETDQQFIANGLGEDLTWVKENLYFIRMVASDTRVDSQWDKFNEAVITALGMQYAGGWGEGMVGGSTLCIMHDREKMIGRTYRYEIQDAKDAAGNAILDENGTQVKELVVFAYISRTAQYKGEAVENFIRDGRLSKVSISAYVWNWQYIPSDRSNWIPEGETETSGFFFYTDPNAVRVVELSIVDMGANSSGRITKAKKATVTIEDEPNPTAKSETPPASVEEPPVEEKLEEKAQDLNEEGDNSQDATAILEGGEISLNINIGEYNKMKSFWDLTPVKLQKGSAIKWEEITLENHGDGKSFYAPDYCAVRFRNMDKTIGTQKSKISELQTKVSDLESQVSNSNEKMIGSDLDKQVAENALAAKVAEITALQEKYAKMESELLAEKKVYMDRYVVLKSEIEDNKHDIEAVQALKTIAESMTMSELRKQNEALNVAYITKKEKTALKDEPKLPQRRKTF